MGCLDTPIFLKFVISILEFFLSLEVHINLALRGDQTAHVTNIGMVYDLYIFPFPTIGNRNV